MRGPPDPSAKRELERLLSKAGLCSRKEASSLVRAGRVRVNGVVILDPEAWFDPARDRIEVDGRKLASAKKRYVALHKPRGYVTTRSDPDGRPTVYDLLVDLGDWVVTVGRLDLDTSGLLLLSNDTQFADRVTSPSSHVPKCYKVEASPRLAPEAYERLRRGVVLHDGPTRPALVEPIGDRGPASVFRITIDEGRNRQVRRMVREVGSKVQKLARVSIGELELGTLASGTWRDLTAAEVERLLAPRRPRRAD
jgi:23S rRNA pseudouridine2605 synthase